MSKTIFVFPGQGAQYVGMGKALSESFAPAKQLLEKADDTLGFSISKVMFEGPEEELKITANTQPALFVSSMMVLEVLKAEGIDFDLVAGHSLGGMIAQQVAADDGIKRNYVVMNTVTFGSPLLSAGSREGIVKRLGDTSDVIPYMSGSIINNTAWAIAGLQREDGHYWGNSLNAHVNSYTRADVWGKYDVTGTKWGGATLTVQTYTTKYFHSPTNMKW